MEKDKNIRINRLTTEIPEYRLQEIRTVMEMYDLPVLLTTMLRYLPEANFRMMIEDMQCEASIILESQMLKENLPGSGAMKILVGKSAEGTLSDGDCDKIGKIIASMDGRPKGYYVGMMNFLGASCRIHHRIRESYKKGIISRMGNGVKPENVPGVVADMFKGVVEPSEEQIKKATAAESARLEKLPDRQAEQAEEKPEIIKSQDLNTPPPAKNPTRDENIVSGEKKPEKAPGWKKENWVAQPAAQYNEKPKPEPTPELKPEPEPVTVKSEPKQETPQVPVPRIPMLKIEKIPKVEDQPVKKNKVKFMYTPPVKPKGKAGEAYDDTLK